MAHLSNHRILLSLLAGLTLVSACQKDEAAKTPRLQDALPGMPIPVNPVFVSRSGSADALQVVLTTDQSPEATALFYRGILSRAPWTLVSDQPFDSGGRVLYASRKGPPLWVTIKPNPKGPGSQVSLNGAVVTTSGDTALHRIPADTGKKKKP